MAQQTAGAGPPCLEQASLALFEERLAQPSQFLRRLTGGGQGRAGGVPGRSAARPNQDVEEMFSKYMGEPVGGAGWGAGTDDWMGEGKGVGQEGDDRRPVSDCRVCGDRAIAHLHYGGICCYSCKVKLLVTPLQ